MSRGPTKKTLGILSAAMAHVSSVPYRVSLRWLFYRLLQECIFQEKEDYKAFIGTLGRYRRAFKLGWRPDTLVDDTRRTTYDGWGSLDAPEAMRNLLENAEELLCLSHFVAQPNYVEVWYEAEAMSRQFQYYCKGVPLRPFKGDYTLEPKWRTARDLNDALARFGLPIVILYFGDAEPGGKGDQIPETAFRDVLDYCDREAEESGRSSARDSITYVRVGLTVEQARAMKLTRDPDKEEETYQWEAVSDDQAREMIDSAMAQFLDMSEVEAAARRTKVLAEKVRRKLTAKGAA